MRASWETTFTPHRSLCLSLGITAFACVMGQVEFAGYDSSMLIDTGWRLHLGQVPYRDFPCMLPPSFYLLCKLAIAIFGVHWYSFTLLGTLFTSCLLVVGYHLHAVLHGSGRVDEPLLLQIYFIAVLSPLLITSHIWHSAFAAQINVFLLFSLILLYESWVETKCWNTIGLIYCIVALCGVLLEKPNTAIVCFITTMILALLPKRRLHVVTAWLFATFMGLLLSVFILAVNSICPGDVVRSYMEISGRPSPWLMIVSGVAYQQTTPGSLSTVTAYVILFTLCLTAFYCIRRQSLSASHPRTAFAIGCLAISLTGFATNWDLKFIDLSPALFGLGALLSEGLPRYTKHRIFLGRVHTMS